MKFCCANCGCELHDVIFTVLDNFLIVNYFDDNKSNRFCSRNCACEALMIESVEKEQLPLDDDEKDEEERVDELLEVEE